VLLDAYHAGKLEPVHVETQELPQWAKPSMRQVLDKLALCSGLLLAKGDDGTVIFAVDWAAERFGVSGSTVSIALRRLRKCGAIRLVKVLPPVESRRAGARVYAVVPGRPNLQVLEGGQE
jgi:DNA-binding transcriptional ArsR family regulator